MKKSLRKQKEGYFQIRYKPSLQYLQRFYAKKYFQQGLGSYEIKYDNEELNWIHKKNKFREKLVTSFMPVTLKRRKTFLDVGCGEGFALKIFNRSGWDVKGLDFSSAGIAQQNPNLKNKVITGDIETNLKFLHEKQERFSCIMLCNVLEHVVDPKNLLRLLKKIIEKKGILIVTVPNDFSITQKLALKAGYIKKRFWISLPEHLSYFEFNSLRNLLHSTGWQKKEIYGDFPVDWFLFHKGSNYVATKRNVKAAHRAQIKIEAEILNQPHKYSASFLRSLAMVGMGRNLTGIFQDYN